MQTAETPESSTPATNEYLMETLSAVSGKLRQAMDVVLASYHPLIPAYTVLPSPLTRATGPRASALDTSTNLRNVMIQRLMAIKTGCEEYFNSSIHKYPARPEDFKAFIQTLDNYNFGDHATSLPTEPRQYSDPNRQSATHQPVYLFSVLAQRIFADALAGELGVEPDTLYSDKLRDSLTSLDPWKLQAANANSPVSTRVHSIAPQSTKQGIAI